MEIQHLPKEKVILQHNIISSGRYDYTACQLDILFTLLAILEKNDSEEKIYHIYRKDIEVLTGRKWDYFQLKKSIEIVGNRAFSMYLGKDYELVWLFQHVKYLDGQGCFEATISKKIRPYLFDLKDNFTAIGLHTILSLKSKFAKRLYGLACQWRTVGKIEIPILKLKEMLFLKDPEGKSKEQFERLNAFKEKVLDIAKRQINEHTDIHFDYQLRKRGRSFTLITFFIEEKELKPTVININMNLDYQKRIKTVMSYGVSEESAALIAEKGFKDFEELIGTMLKEMRKNPTKFENPAAYIVGVFQKKGIIPTKIG